MVNLGKDYACRIIINPVFWLMDRKPRNDTTQILKPHRKLNASSMKAELFVVFAMDLKYVDMPVYCTCVIWNEPECLYFTSDEEALGGGERRNDIRVFMVQNGSIASVF
uniref:uncharacterized protein LOC118528545 isoform X5 n=1 Tax=Halichoerus grypus TaxID=9711 RepID=UPI00165941AC|nr:uncharacterized protein LOC118528545 isoform X5 [Halichoerus grypus]